MSIMFDRFKHYDNEQLHIFVGWSNWTVIKEMYVCIVKYTAIKQKIKFLIKKIRDHQQDFTSPRLDEGLYLKQRFYFVVERTDRMRRYRVWFKFFFLLQCCCPVDFAPIVLFYEAHGLNNFDNTRVIEIYCLFFSFYGVRDQWADV